MHLAGKYRSVEESLSQRLMNISSDPGDTLTLALKARAKYAPAESLSLPLPERRLCDAQQSK